MSVNRHGDAAQARGIRQMDQVADTHREQDARGVD
jgi:hypothetical protein